MDVLGSNQCTSQTRSINLTEYARGLQENSNEDLGEVESNPNHDYVKGHKVKKEIASLIRAIFDKYGDLTRESEVRSPQIISFFFERVCDVYQKLKLKKFSDFTSAEINDMIDKLQFFQNEKLEVRWLLEKLQHIYETKSSVLKYLEIKREAEQCVESYKRIDKELALLQIEMFAAEEEKMANQAKANEYAKIEGTDQRRTIHVPKDSFFGYD